MVLLSWSAALLTLAGIACASPMPGDFKARSSFPDTWYQRPDHPAHKLFRREPTGSRLGRRGPPEPSVGSSAWTAQYPSGTPDNSKLPQAWVDALNQTVAANKIPNIPPTTITNNGSPQYPDGTNQNRDTPSVCSWTNMVCRMSDVIYDAPDGIMALGFDDGPSQYSPQLYTFLKQNNQTAAHYFIGLNILANWQVFLSACDMGGDIAVHTWNHPYMTTLDNMSILAQLGWTMQIIYDSSGGKLPSYWRPPYGDIDARVDAIARHVFGLTAIVWNHDTGDWTIGTSGGATPESIQANMVQWLSGPKSPGLIILEHELVQTDIQVFQTAWPLVQSNGWKAVSQLRMNSSMIVYQNGSGQPDTAFASLIPNTTTTSAKSTSTESGNRTATGVNAAQSTASSSAAPIFAQPSLATFVVSLLFLFGTQSLL